MAEIMQRGISMHNDVRMLARIKVVGVGGGGCNAVRRMMQQWQTPGVEYIAVNTDIKSLELMSDTQHIQIGGHLTRGFGAGGDIKIGELAAEEGRVNLQRAIKGAELIFITAGMGGGTGTGSAPVVADLARESGALTVAVVTTPFSFEGSKRAETALIGLRSLMKKVNSVIIVPNDQLLRLGDHDVPVREAFLMADRVIAEGILAISELVNVPGEINVDLADVTRVLGIPGIALMTTGWGEGGSGAEKAAEAVIFDPFLETHVNGAKGVLFNFSGGPDLTIGGVDRAASLISEHVDPQAVVFFGMSLPREELKGKVKLTLVATGVKSPLSSDRRSEVGESLRKAIPRVSLRFSKK
jgi:cell division protein FtsZ